MSNKTIVPVELEVPYDLKTINMFLYRTANGLTLIDACLNRDESWELLQRTMAEAGFGFHQFDRILLTHHHIDHIGLVNRILEKRDIPVYVHPVAIPRLNGDEEYKQRKIAFYKKMYSEAGCGDEGTRYIENLRNGFEGGFAAEAIAGELVPLASGAPVPELADLLAIETPGHAPDHLIFYDQAEKCLFSGDHLIEHISSNAIVEPDDEGNRMKTLIQYRESLQKVRDLDVSVVYPGHGKPYQGHSALIERRLSRMVAKGDRIVSMLGPDGLTPYQLALELYPQHIKTQFHLVMSEVIGTLDYLEVEQKVGKELVGGVWHYKAR